jgi:hypothetical protein
VRLDSNVHLLVEKGTVIKPHWPEGTKTCVFLLDAERPSRKNSTPAQDKAFIENVSIRGLGGRWTIDYSDRERKQGEGIRGVLTKMVRNFLIADLDIRDNYTTYCGITLTPTNSRIKDTSDWEITRSTDGTIRNCRIFNASPGYGLTQLHGAQSIHYEDIHAVGGVALRLETGAGGLHTGVFDITARNVTCENGRCAVMFGPHSARNGLVQVEDVKTRSCTFGVTIGKGGVKEAQLKIEPDATDGIFAEGSYVKGLHVEFGKTAQVKTHMMLFIPEDYHDDLNLRWFDKFFEGPSIGAVKDSTEGHFKILSSAMERMFRYPAPRVQDNELFSQFKYTPLRGFDNNGGDGTISRRDPSRPILVDGQVPHLVHEAPHVRTADWGQPGSRGHRPDSFDGLGSVRNLARDQQGRFHLGGARRCRSASAPSRFPAGDPWPRPTFSFGKASTICTIRPLSSRAERGEIGVRLRIVCRLARRAMDAHAQNDHRNRQERPLGSGRHPRSPPRGLQGQNLHVLQSGLQQMARSPRQIRGRPGLGHRRDPLGPFVKHRLNPVLNSGHETTFFPFKKGMAALAIKDGNERSTMQYAEDGVNFEIASVVSLPPSPPRRSRPMRLQTRRMDEALPGACAISSMPGLGETTFDHGPF